MASYNSFKEGQTVKVVKIGLESTGFSGKVAWKRRGLIGVHVTGFGGTLAFNPSSLKVVDLPKAPSKPLVYKIGCKEIGQGINQTFDTKEEALSRLEKWSQQIGGRVCQLYVLDSEYKTEVATKLVKVS